MMDSSFATLNNVGTIQLASGHTSEAIGFFLRSLREAKMSLAERAKKEDNMARNSSSAEDKEGNRCRETVAVHSPRIPIEAFVPFSMPLSTSTEGLYLSPLYLSESADYDRYDTSVEASVAIMYNLALAHHLNALFGTAAANRETALDQAISLYELAYNVHMQEEDADLSVEFTMAVVNNLGHIHRLKGDEAKADKCFHHLLSTMLFLRSYGSADSKCVAEPFVHSITHLILQDTVAPAA
mmetsp:Transcript_20807/g.33529  ORF Transcript_20807/g.33529 Transcript_20807/m.33529 type:complete len:240 (+) Transcript_20807:479-1198(+)